MSIRITDKDTEFFTWLSNGRAWTPRQLSALTGESQSNVRRRLSRLKGSRLLSSSPPLDDGLGRREASYYVTPRDRRQVLRVAPGVDLAASPRRSATATPHHRLVNEFWMSLHVALAKQEYYTYRFLPHYQYDSSDIDTPVYIAAPTSTSSRRPKPIIADFALSLACGRGGALAFGEIDRGSESGQAILEKLRAYAAYHDAGGYVQAASLLGKRYKGFRTLVVTTSSRRLANIRKLCAELGSVGFIWLTILERITPEAILTPIWVSADDNVPRSLTLEQSPGARDGGR